MKEAALPVSDQSARLTVVVTTYVRPDYLANCLASIAAQTYRDFSVIVLDNGSSASYEAVIDQFRDLELKYIRQPENIGASGNIIQAFEQYRESDYLMVFHDDDLMHPRMLEWLVGVLDGDPTCAFAASEYAFFEGDAPLLEQWDLLDAPAIERFENATGLARLFMSESPVGFGSVVYRTNALAKASPDFDTFNMYWDRPFLLKFAEQGGCAIARAPLMMYGCIRRRTRAQTS